MKRIHLYFGNDTTVAFAERGKEPRYYKNPSTLSLVRLTNLVNSTHRQYFVSLHFDGWTASRN